MEMGPLVDLMNRALIRITKLTLFTAKAGKG
jgi:hypothetical protein